jgi:hypothetical protein
VLNLAGGAREAGALRLVTYKITCNGALRCTIPPVDVTTLLHFPQPKVAQRALHPMLLHVHSTDDLCAPITRFLAPHAAPISHQNAHKQQQVEFRKDCHAKLQNHFGWCHFSMSMSSDRIVMMAQTQ